VRRSKLVGTHTRRRLYVLFLGGICEEINAGWNTRKRMYVLWVGGVCEEIELGVPSKGSINFEQCGEVREERKGVCEEIGLVGSQKVRMYVLRVEEGWECHDGWSYVLILIVLHFEEVFGRGVGVVGKFVGEI